MNKTHEVNITQAINEGLAGAPGSAKPEGVEVFIDFDASAEKYGKGSLERAFTLADVMLYEGVTFDNYTFKVHRKGVELFIPLFDSSGLVCTGSRTLYTCPD